MRITADYHTHTTFSHGKGSVRDNVEAAIQKGLTAVGIADHSISHFVYGVKRSKFGDYISCIESAKKEYDGRIEVKAGIELNLVGLDGSVDMPQSYKLDIVLLGYHKLAVYSNIKTAWYFYTGRTRFGKKYTDRLTDAYIRAVQKQRIDIIAHPGYGIPVDFYKLAKACADYGTMIEINNKHAEMTEEELAGAATTGVKFVISSDAHAPGDVGEVSRAIAFAEEAGLGADRIVNAVEE